MPEKLTNNQPTSLPFLSRATVVLVKHFGSWGSVLIHTLFFAICFLLKFNLEVLLVIVSLEAIYIGIFILMAENVESQQRDAIRKRQRQYDMSIVRQDAKVDEQSLSELKYLRKQIDSLHQLIKK